MHTVLRKNLDRVLARIEAARAKRGEDSPPVSLLAVTKSVPSAVALALTQAGQTDLGENRIDVLEQKLLDFERSGGTARWHFIGHIQRNKAARVVRASDVIHSVDSLKLLAVLDRHAREHHRKPAIYLQVKLSHEEAKHGLSVDELNEALAQVRELDALELVGLMTMAPRANDPAAQLAAAQHTFETLADLARSLPGQHFSSGRPLLSMGMSGDYAEAIAAGADIVRVGSALFEGVDPSEFESSSGSTEGRSS